MSLLNKNFNIGEHVRFVGIPQNDELHDMTGIVIGRTVDMIIDTYIVLLDRPLTYREDKAVNIVESCLEKI